MPQPTVPVVNPYDYVTCAKHNARRLARFCAPCPVYNADHEIINYVFECKADQLCSSAQRQANSNTHVTSRSGVMDSQANSSGRRVVHDDAAQDSTTADKQSGPVQAMVFDASSSSNTNTAMHVNAFRNAGGGGSGALHKSNESAAQQGTTLFSVSFTAPKETTGAGPASRMAGEADALAATSEATTQQQQQVSGKEDDEEVRTSGQVKSTSCAAPDEQHNKKEEDEEEEIVNDEGKTVSTRPTNETATADKPLTTSANSSSPPTQFNSPRAPLRYYDMLQRAGNVHGGIGGGMMTGFTGHGAGPGNSSMPKKVCWYCGLAGHEKQECTNTLCRNCHTRRPANQYNPHNNNSSSSNNSNMPAYHTCVPVREVSPFIVVPRILPQGRDGMPAVRCVSCGAYGHFDCSAAATTTTTPFSRMSGVEGQHEESTTTSAGAAVPSLSSPVATGSLNCCFCGNRGHTAFDCYERKRVNPDRWEQRVLALSGAENCGESEARYHHNNNTPNYTNYQGNTNSSNNSNYRQGYRGNATRSETERGGYYGTSSTGLSYQGQQQQRGAQNYNTPGNYYSNELAASSRRRPREAYESGEYTTPRTYREEHMTRDTAVREYDTTVSASRSASKRGDERQHEQHHRSASGSHTTHHSHHSDHHHHHRHHRSHNSDNEEDDEEATSSHRARHVRRREGERSSHHSTRASSRDKTRGGDEEGGESYARRREESEGDKYGYNRPYNRSTIAQQQQQQSLPYNTYNRPASGNTYAGGRTNSNNAYQYEGNAGRAEMSRTRSYHAPNMPQQGYATPSYRDKGRMDTPNYNNSNSNRGYYNAGPAERQYGRRANDTRQYGYNSPAGQAQYHQPAQRWRTEASSYGPQSRTRQNYRGGRNNNNNDDDESDLY